MEPEWQFKVTHSDGTSDELDATRVRVIMAPAKIALFEMVPRKHGVPEQVGASVDLQAGSIVVGKSQRSNDRVSITAGGVDVFVGEDNGSRLVVSVVNSARE